MTTTLRHFRLVGGRTGGGVVVLVAHSAGTVSRSIDGSTRSPDGMFVRPRLGQPPKRAIETGEWRNWQTQGI